MPNSKKIAFVIHGLNVGGAEKFLISVVNHFARNGFQPYVLILSNALDIVGELDPRVIVSTFIKKSKWDIRYPFQIKSFLIANGISKVFCVNTYSFFITKMGFMFNKDIQFFLSLHSTIPLSFRHYFKNMICYRAVSKNDTILYLCNNQRNYLQNKYQIPSANYKIINNGVDNVYFNPSLFSTYDYYDIRNALGFSSSDQLIIQVARISPEKGHLYAIKALQILHEQYHRKAHLLFVGDGSLEYVHFLNMQIKKFNLQSFVHFLGVQSDVRKYYKIADVFTLTSSSETFSIAALEAMAYGLPCSLTNVGGANEMVIEGFNGFLAKPNDAISIATSWYKILKHPLKGSAIRNHFLSHYTSHDMLDQYQQVLSNYSYSQVAI
jgi:glycosyltransferase involved in cell wall biosynthesis